MVIVVKKEVLDLEKERELLSTPSKRVWDNMAAQIEVVANELDLSTEQKEALFQRTMAEIRHRDMQEINKYLARTEEASGKKAISKNKESMYRMERVYIQNSHFLNDVEDQVYDRLEELEQERIKNEEKNRVNK